MASQLEDKQLTKYVDGVAWHGYEGTPDQMSLVHRKDPGMPFYWTEGGPFIDDPDYGRDWAKWGGIFTDVLELSLIHISALVDTPSLDASLGRTVEVRGIPHLTKNGSDMGHPWSVGYGKILR